jgi:hypothetical protein
VCLVGIEMADIATLGLKIDSSDADKASQDLDALATSGKKAEDQLTKIERAASMGGRATEGYSEALADAYGITSKLSDAQVKAIRAFEDLIARTQLSGSELTTYNALRATSTKADSQAATVIADLARTYHDLAESQKNASLAAKESGSAFKSDLESRLGIGKSATSNGATFSALQEQAKKLDMIDAARAKQNASFAQSQINVALGIDRVSKSAKDSASAFEELLPPIEKVNRSGTNLANTLTKRFVMGYLISQAKQAAAAVAELNDKIARTGDIGKLTGLGSGNVQGIISAAGTKGIDNNAMSSALVAFNQQIPLAKAGVGELGQLLRANKVTVSDTGDAFFKVADLVARTKNDTARMSILQQAGLPATMEMVRFMSQGADAIKQQIDQTSKLSESQVQAAQRVRDAWQTYWQQWKDSATLAIADVLGKLGNLARAARNATQSGRERRVNQGVVDAVNGIRGQGATPNSLVSGAFGALGNGPSGSDSLLTALQNRAKQMSGQGDTRDWATEKAIQQDRISKAQQYLGLLGATTTATEARRAVELQLASAGLNNVGIDSKRAELLKQLAEEQNLGTLALKAQTDAQRVEAETIGMSVGAAQAYTAEQNLLNEAKRNHKELTDANRAAIAAEAQALGDAAQRADNMRWGYENLVRGPLQTLQSQLANGAKFFDAIKAAGMSALNSIASKLMDMASQGLWQAAFGGSRSGGGLLSLLGIGGGGELPGWGTNSFVGPLPAGGAHSGKGPGDPWTFVRNVDPAVFNNAPRFHTGIGPGERAAIIRNDESVLTPGQMKQLAPVGSGKPSVSITNYNDFRGADPGSEARIKAYVDDSNRRAVEQAVQAVSKSFRSNPAYLGSRQ